MKILFAAAEIAPLTKVGGLADVVRSLPAELIQAGHDVRVMVPRYGFLDLSAYRSEPVQEDFFLLALKEYRRTAVDRIDIDGIPVYLINSDVFAHTPSVYGDDEIGKFFVYCRSVCEAIPRLGWSPDIVHCHDWHASLVPLMLRRQGLTMGTLLTIHNVRYQGSFDEPFLYNTGLQECWQASAEGFPSIPLNFLSMGVIWSDAVNTVSEGFAREMLTPGQGYGMEDVLSLRKGSLSGIVNGLGYEEYDPDSDSLIRNRYSWADLRGKVANKRALQLMAGFADDPAVPLIGMVSRLDDQKGLNIIVRAVRDIVKDCVVQFVFQGRGREQYEHALMALEARYPEHVRAFITFDNKKAHLIYAGADMFLMPSLYEPCGLGQLIAMRYGTVPIVRRTGGLADTVEPLSKDISSGSGFVFDNYDAAELTRAVAVAVEAYRDRAAWGKVVKRIMALDFSWKESASRYEMLYEKILRRDGHE
jgi:starch synthase